jgi:hypothetical protein
MDVINERKSALCLFLVPVLRHDCVVYAELLAETTRHFDTYCTVKNEQRLLSLRLSNIIEIGLEVSKVGDCSHLEERS